MQLNGPAGQPGAPGGAQMNEAGGGNQDGGCATATGLAPVSYCATIDGRFPAPAVPSVTTRFAVEPDSAIAKKGAVDTGSTQSSPAGASKPERSPTMLSG